MTRKFEEKMNLADEDLPVPVESRVIAVPPDDSSEVVENSNTSKFEEDFEFSRQQIRGVADKANLALDDLNEIRKESEKSSDYEAYIGLLKTVLDSSDTLMKIYNVSHKIGALAKPQPINVQNAIFVGSPSELKKALKEIKKEDDEPEKT